MGSSDQGPGYTIEPFDRLRELVIDVMIPAQKKHNIHVLFEADITDVRKYLRKQKAEMGESISLTAFLIKCTADATMTNKRLSGRRISARRLVVCDDMHVSCMVETEIDGQSLPSTAIWTYPTPRELALHICEQLEPAAEPGPAGDEPLEAEAEAAREALDEQLDDISDDDLLALGEELLA